MNVHVCVHHLYVNTKIPAAGLLDLTSAVKQATEELLKE